MKWPTFTNQEIKKVLSVIKSGNVNYWTGNEVKNFEKEFSNYIGNKYSIGVCNATLALEASLRALNITSGDEVITTPRSYNSSASCILKVGAKPIFVDVDILTQNISVLDLKKKITKKTKAIIVTHIYSFSNDMDKIIKICKKNRIFLIEDAAEVIGLKYKNKPCGSFGDISTFSFYANKQLTTGEGGMISTNNLKFYKKFKALRNLCFGSKQRFNHEDIGWNYRMSNLHAALGINQLKRLNSVVKQKLYIGNYYYKRLSKNRNIYMTPPKISYSKNIYWVVGILIKNKKILASRVIKKLATYGVGARPFFWPMHEQKIFKKMKIFNKTKYPHSSYLGRYGFYIPSYLQITNAEMDYVISKINKLL